MNQISKLSIERAELKIRRIVSDKVQKWMRKNSAPCKELEPEEAAVIALSDPRWRNNFIKAVKKGNRWSCEEQVISMSPMASAEQKKRKLKRTEWEKSLGFYKDELESQGQQIVDDAVISGLSGIEFINAINNWSKFFP